MKSLRESAHLIYEFIVPVSFNDVDASGSSSYNIDKANFYYSYDGADWTKIGSELSMAYDLKLLP